MQSTRQARNAKLENCISFITMHLLILISTLSLSRAVEYDGLKKKAAFMEELMDMHADPCQDFWTYANGNLEKAKLPDKYKEIARILSMESDRNSSSVLEQVKIHFKNCTESSLKFFRTLYRELKADSEATSAIQSFSDSLYNKSFIEDDDAYFELLQTAYRLQFLYGGSELTDFTSRVRNHNRFHFYPTKHLGEYEKDVHKTTINLKETNVTNAEDFVCGIFGERFDISKIKKVDVAFPTGDQKYLRDVILNSLSISLWSSFTIPHYDECADYIIDTFPMLFTKLKMNDIGHENVSKLNNLFYSDLDLLLITVKQQFHYGNLLSQQMRDTLVERLKSNVFFGLKHQIFDDDVFEAYFANETTFDKPLQNKWKNNLLPILRAAAGKDSRYYAFLPITFNAFHTFTHQNVFSITLFKFPYFDLSYPPVLRLSALGFIAGHELGHDFDNDLSTVKTFDDTYQRIFDCLYNFYNHQCSPEAPEKCLDSKFSMNENFADIFGVQMAYLAYKRDAAINGIGQRPRGNILDKLSDDQIFFINLAQVMYNFRKWNTPSFTEDTHSPVPNRLYGALAGFPAFVNAFNCSVGSYYHPANNCKLYSDKSFVDYNLSNR